MRRPIAFVAALLIGLPVAARAQWSDDDRGPSQDDGRWSDGRWSGDDDSEWTAPSPGDPRDGYAPPDEHAGQGDDGRDEYGRSGDDGRRQSDRRDEGEQDRRYDSRERAGPSMRDFRAGLDRHGRWIDTPEYGLVWQPTRVSYGWRPYWDGRWVYTSAGWTWVTDEPWGWATYHYGRWANVDGMGWVWLPGQVWAPAWVAWRWGQGVAGWCPLGPRGVVYEQPHFWVFVQSTRFLEPVRRAAVPVVDVRVYYARARPLPMFRPGILAGPARRVVEVETRRTVRPVPIVDARTPGTSALPSGAVQVWRPRTAPIAHTVLPARGGEVPKGSQPNAPPAQQMPAPRAWGTTAPNVALRPAAPAPSQPRPLTGWGGQRDGAAEPARDASTPRAGDAPFAAGGHPARERDPAPARRAEPAAEPRFERPRPAAEPARPATERPRPATEPARPAAERPRPAEPARPAAEPHANAAPRRPQPIVEHGDRAEARPEPHGGAAARPVAAPHAASAAIVRIEKKRQ